MYIRKYHLKYVEFVGKGDTKSKKAYWVIKKDLHYINIRNNYESNTNTL